VILEISADELIHLSDSDLRELIGKLCEREVRNHGYSPSAVTWGGHQDTPDGGIDVRVALPHGSKIEGFVPRENCGFQVKAQKMPASAIKDEMVPDGIVRDAIVELTAAHGAYIIVSSKDSCTDPTLKTRVRAMSDSVSSLSDRDNLGLAFYDRARLATWLREHQGLVPWVRERLGSPLSGWRPFQDWSSSPTALDTQYLQDDAARVYGPSVDESRGLSLMQAIERIRNILSKPGGIVRLVGLSGVGKTRLVQSLFDERIGANALLKTDALYADISDAPDPVPVEMLSRLAAANQRVVLIVDNCGNELHQKLATHVGKVNGQVSVVTIEFDINDDEPANTEVFRLEPSSPELIDKILEVQFPSLPYPSRQTIAKFSEGNARVAIALASTAGSGETITELKDSALFERLFAQHKGVSVELLDGAKALALLYSFDGVTVEGSESELAVLGRLVDQSANSLFKHAAELHRRRLIQKRGKWRAVLPHALANRLAKRALQDIPASRIQTTIVCCGIPRVLRSFSRRIGYLSDDPNALAIVTEWLGPKGILESLGKLDELQKEMFENIASLHPTTTLEHIEKTAAANASWFFGTDNQNREQVVGLLRAIAFDAGLFTRCAELLVRFVLVEAPSGEGSSGQVLRSLFWMWLSGTHASAEQRSAFVDALLSSNELPKQELGGKLIDEMLKTDHFSSHYTFEFGGRKRDYGHDPRTHREVANWYAQAIALCKRHGTTNRPVSRAVRHVLANHLRRLIEIGMRQDTFVVAREFSADGGWTEGWIGIRSVLRRHRETLPDDLRAELTQLEQELRPTELTKLVQTYALTREWTALDIADDEDQDPVEARRKIHEFCIELGRQLAGHLVGHKQLFEEVILSTSQKVIFLGRGIATGSSNLSQAWEVLLARYFEAPEKERRSLLLSGYLSGAIDLDEAIVEKILEAAFDDPRLRNEVLRWQVDVGLRSGAYPRLLKAARDSTFPVEEFRQLAYGRVHEGLDDSQLTSLLRELLPRDPNGLVTIEILGMRVFGRRSAEEPIGQAIRAACRELLATIKVTRRHQDVHLLPGVVKAAYADPGTESDAQAFCDKLVSALSDSELYAFNIGEVLTAIGSVKPRVFLDKFVEESATETRLGRSLFRDTTEFRGSPFDEIPDEQILQWANEQPATRYELLAKGIRYASTKDDEEEGKVLEWSPIARKLFEHAPNPVPVLNALMLQFRPNGWSGSLALILEKRKVLIEELLTHPSPQISAWANENKVAYATEIEHARTWEAERDNRRDQTFE
jgi:hypothetical protein